MLQETHTSHTVLSNQISLQGKGCVNETPEDVNTGPCPCMKAKQQHSVTCDFPEIRALVPAHVYCGNAEVCKFRQIKALEDLFAEYRVLSSGLINGKFATSQVDLLEPKRIILSQMQPIIENHFE